MIIQSTCIHLSFLFHFAHEPTWTCMFGRFWPWHLIFGCGVQKQGKKPGSAMRLQVGTRVPPKHAGSTQASPVVWRRKIQVATKGYKSRCKSIPFHISAYRFTNWVFSEPEWSSQNVAHPTNRCDKKMIQVSMQGQIARENWLVVLLLGSFAWHVYIQ